MFLHSEFTLRLFYFMMLLFQYSNPHTAYYEWDFKVLLTISIILFDNSPLFSRWMIKAKVQCLLGNLIDFASILEIECEVLYIK